MCSSISSVVSSISFGVTLAKDLFLFMLRYTTSNNMIGGNPMNEFTPEGGPIFTS